MGGNPGREFKSYQGSPFFPNKTKAISSFGNLCVRRERSISLISV